MYRVLRVVHMPYPRSSLGGVFASRARCPERDIGELS